MKPKTSERIVKKKKYFADGNPWISLFAFQPGLDFDTLICPLISATRNSAVVPS
jgi:hypothetical protein